LITRLVVARMPHDLFLSYSSKDREVAREVQRLLTGGGFRCWWDDAELLGGDNLLPVIRKAIGSCAAVVWLASPDACASDWVMAELTEARRRKIAIVPVLLAPLEEIRLRPPLRDDLSLGGMKCHVYDGSAESLVRACRGFVRARRRRSLVHNLFGAVALCLGGALVFTWSRPLTPAAPAAADPKRQLLADLVADGDLVADAATTTTRPRILCDMLARRSGARAFAVLNDGDALKSIVDGYILLIQPRTSGYLYVFQVDSAGKLDWVFPKNAASAASTGSNPVPADQVVQIPSGDTPEVLFLDENQGVERIYVVLSASRWDELERRLAAAQAVPMPSESRGLDANFKNRGVGGRRRVDGIPSAVKPQDDGLLELPCSGLEYEASGNRMIICRWFRHK
jgi:hypothetical protein